ncbi:MAG: nucleotidyl transferase AbiEii/AbiGii toxin family protein [Nitrosotalea sp.]
MIEGQVLKKLARDWKLKVEDVEKYYILGWILYGISKSTIGKRIVFKGGTAISKVYFPSRWRLSEDLDFTDLDGVDWNTVIVDALEKEIPEIVQKESGISLLRKQMDVPHTNVGYLQYKMSYTGPLFSGMIKIEVTKETFLGKVVTKPIPNDPIDFDYPEFSLQVYSLETIMSEKMRAILQRGLHQRLLRCLETIKRK